MTLEEWRAKADREARVLRLVEWGLILAGILGLALSGHTPGPWTFDEHGGEGPREGLGGDMGRGSSTSAVQGHRARGSAQGAQDGAFPGPSGAPHGSPARQKRVRAEGWKVFTHDFRSPVQSDAPRVWSGELPFDLPPVALDTSSRECGAGWNYTAKLEEALAIAGLWPTGRPSIGVLVEPGSDAITRGTKCRASTLRLVRLATDAEMEDAIRRFTKVFGPHEAELAEEQIAWCRALARPDRDPAAVERGLIQALEARGLPWEPKRFESQAAARAAWDARDARDAWDAWAARAAWAAWDAWAARAARDAWAAWDARDAWAARDARDARDAWDARAAWDARDAWAALSVCFAARQGWIEHPADLLTRGLRDAYASGLDVALPTGPNELGWSMVGEPR